jgi:RNase adapter protein RapZ
MLFLDCAGTEIERRYTETRRRHPLAQDRPAMDGIAEERTLMEPLRRWADMVIDSTRLSSSELQAKIRENFRTPTGTMTVSLMSFGFSRGVPHNVDMIFDMRFLRNPHWDTALRPKTGLDADVAAYVEQDPAYAETIDKIADLLGALLPRYDAQGIGFGCTGGRHRSVHITEQMGDILRKKGYMPSIEHRNLHSRPIDALEWQGNRGDLANRN